MARTTTTAGAVHQAARAGQNAATNRWVTALARAGYAAKGVVYLIIGLLAAKAAIGDGGATTDNRGALLAIYAQPFGRFLLGVVAIGLVGYALWSLVRAIFDVEHQGTGGKGVAARLGFGAVGISYALLAAGAIQLVTGTGSGGKSTDTTAHDWTARFLGLPFGPFIVALVGLIVVGVALFLFYRSYAADFRKQLNLAQLGSQAQQAVVALGRLGYAALGVVFSIVGVFLVIAALRHNAGATRGLGGALRELERQPYGFTVLGVVAVGLIAYGLFSLAQARYRRIGTA